MLTPPGSFIYMHKYVSLIFAPRNGVVTLSLSHGRIPRRKLLLFAEHKSCRHSLAETYLIKGKEFWNKILFLVLKLNCLVQMALNEYGDDQVRITAINAPWNMTAETLCFGDARVQLVWDNDSHQMREQRIWGFITTYCWKQYWKASKNQEDIPYSNLIITLNTFHKRVTVLL